MQEACKEVCGDFQEDSKFVPVNFMVRGRNAGGFADGQ
jgi:hypothetical protein